MVFTLISWVVLTTSCGSDVSSLAPEHVSQNLQTSVAQWIARAHEPVSRVVWSADGKSVLLGTLKNHYSMTVINESANGIEIANVENLGNWGTAQNRVDRVLNFQGLKSAEGDHSLRSPLVLKIARPSGGKGEMFELRTFNATPFGDWLQPKPQPKLFNEVISADHKYLVASERVGNKTQIQVVDIRASKVIARSFVNEQLPNEIIPSDDSNYFVFGNSNSSNLLVLDLSDTSAPVLKELALSTWGHNQLQVRHVLHFVRADESSAIKGLSFKYPIIRAASPSRGGHPTDIKSRNALSIVGHL
ncbi:MAG: hypothetical protein JWQ35_2542 [Bacteriovoracaceae bacterium]|nr:hypothetical protein [Bacteriovoracaceae bacterium]